jgi:MFS family permease
VRCSRETTIAAAGLAALAAAMGIGRFAFTPLLPMMQAEGGLTLVRGGWLASANYLGYLVGALFAARPVAPRIAIRGALLAIALATAAMAYAGHFGVWLLLRFAAGAASAWALLHVSSWCLALLGPGVRPVLRGVVFAGVGVGIALAGMTCLLLMNLGATASEAWLALGLIAALVAAAVWSTLGVTDIPMSTDRLEFRWSAEAVRLVACYGALGFGYIIPATFVPAMARSVVEDPRVFGWAWPIFGMTAAVSTLVAASSPGVGNRNLWRLSAVAMALGVASPLLVGGVAGIVLAALLVGGTFMVITMAGLQEARRVARDGAPSLMAAMTAAFAAGQIAGPLTIPLLMPRAGFSAALVLASGVLAASAVLLPKEKT